MDASSPQNASVTGLKAALRGDCKSLVSRLSSSRGEKMTGSVDESSSGTLSVSVVEFDVLVCSRG